MRAAVVQLDIETGETVTRTFDGEGALKRAAAAAVDLEQQHPTRGLAIFADQAARQEVYIATMQERLRRQLERAQPLTASRH